MHPELQAALEAVQRDLKRCGVQPVIEPWGLAGVWLREPDGTGAVVTISLGSAAEEQVVDLADDVQDWAVEALNAAALPAVWPECPRHPNSHPLQATLVSNQPTWVCPRDSDVVSRIGDLSSGAPRRNA